MLYRYLSLGSKVEEEKEPWKWEVVGLYNPNFTTGWKCNIMISNTRDNGIIYYLY